MHLHNPTKSPFPHTAFTKASQHHSPSATHESPVDLQVYLEPMSLPTYGHPFQSPSYRQEFHSVHHAEIHEISSDSGSDDVDQLQDTTCPYDEGIEEKILHIRSPKLPVFLPPSMRPKKSAPGSLLGDPQLQGSRTEQISSTVHTSISSSNRSLKTDSSAPTDPGRAVRNPEWSPALSAPVGDEHRKRRSKGKRSRKKQVIHIYHQQKEDKDASEEPEKKIYSNAYMRESYDGQQRVKSTVIETPEQPLFYCNTSHQTATSTTSTFQSSMYPSHNTFTSGVSSYQLMYDSRQYRPLSEDEIGRSTATALLRYCLRWIIFVLATANSLTNRLSFKQLANFAPDYWYPIAILVTVFWIVFFAIIVLVRYVFYQKEIPTLFHDAPYDTASSMSPLVPTYAVSWATDQSSQMNILRITRSYWCLLLIGLLESIGLILLFAGNVGAPGSTQCLIYLISIPASVGILFLKSKRRCPLEFKGGISIVLIGILITISSVGVRGNYDEVEREQPMIAYCILTMLAVSPILLSSILKQVSNVNRETDPWVFHLVILLARLVGMLIFSFLLSVPAFGEYSAKEIQKILDYGFSCLFNGSDQDSVDFADNDCSGTTSRMEWTCILTTVHVVVWKPLLFYFVTSLIHDVMVSFLPYLHLSSTLTIIVSVVSIPLSIMAFDEKGMFGLDFHETTEWYHIAGGFFSFFGLIVLNFQELASTLSWNSLTERILEDPKLVAKEFPFYSCGFPEFTNVYYTPILHKVNYDSINVPHTAGPLSLNQSST